MGPERGASGNLFMFTSHWFTQKQSQRKSSNELNKLITLMHIIHAIIRHFYVKSRYHTHCPSNVSKARKKNPSCSRNIGVAFVAEYLNVLNKFWQVKKTKQFSDSSKNFCNNEIFKDPYLYMPIFKFFRAGHFRYFLIFSLIKNDFLHFLSS